jgi:hypothetical protein
MTRHQKKPALAASLIVLVSPALQAAGVYSNASGVTAGAPDNPIQKTSTSIKAWENSVVSYLPAPGVGGSFSSPTTGFASLGDLNASQIGNTAPGSITLSFASSIYDGAGADFAVFENGFIMGSNTSLLFAEYAYVEVSSDGTNFARFASISTNTAPTSGSGAFAYFDVTNVYNLAGKHASGWGTPFDLNELSTHNLVVDGFLDLASILYVRLVDVVGSGLISGNDPGIARDSLGNPILDNWVTTGSGGFDYLGLPSKAIGAINVVPEPSSLLIGGCFAGLFIGTRRRGSRN